MTYAITAPLDPRLAPPPKKAKKPRASRRWLTIAATIWTVLALIFLHIYATEATLPVEPTRPVEISTDPADGVQEGGSQAGTLEGIVDTLFGQDANTVDIVILLTLLTLLPSILIMMTGFTRIIITLSFLRNALGMQQVPPNQVVIGLALFLTFFVMSPTLTEVYEQAYVPYSNGEIGMMDAAERAMVPTRTFMMRQTQVSDMDFFIGLSGGAYESYEDVPNRVLIPAFITSEIKTAFKLGFFIYIPFIVIDMVVASTLMAMGMMMLPPAMISLPFKVLLFVMVDGWQLVIGTVANSFG
jgi:flagellar biosynthetic protein FliP